jgi:hypothetical protein
METCARRSVGLPPSGTACARPSALRVRRASHLRQRRKPAACGTASQEATLSASEAASQKSRGLALLVSTICPLVYILPASAQISAQNAAYLSEDVTVPLILSTLLGGLVFGIFNDGKTRKILEDNVKGRRSVACRLRVCCCLATSYALSSCFKCFVTGFELTEY